MRKIRLVGMLLILTMLCTGCQNELVERAMKAAENKTAVTDKKYENAYKDGLFQKFVFDKTTGDYSVIDTQMGGYLDKISIEPAWKKNSNHVFVISFEQTKPIEIALYIACKKEKNGPVFDEEHKQSAINLIDSVVGDAESTRQFVENLKRPDGRGGTIGSKHYSVSKLTVKADKRQGYKITIK